jgi:cytochrome oxidase Cu insertion factor (SCO1/SenC/PrrC family)
MATVLSFTRIFQHTARMRARKKLLLRLQAVGREDDKHVIWLRQTPGAQRPMLPGMPDADSAEKAAAARPAPAPGSAARRGRLAFWASLAAIILAGAAVITVVAVTRASGGPQLARPTGIPASVSDAQVNLMGLSPVPVRPAPGFTLTDQDGRTLSLASLRGKAVVLEFMDPHCTDICPIVSQEYVDAYRDLGPLAGKVVFAAVNVNQYHAGVSDMMAYSREQRLNTIPAWHFLTGAVPDLRKVWDGYEIAVRAPSPDADIVHTSAVYFIDPAGRERFIAAPMADHTSSGSYLPAGQITAWGQGIAQVARTLAR